MGWISDQCDGEGPEFAHHLCEDPMDCTCPCHEEDDGT